MSHFIQAEFNLHFGRPEAGALDAQTMTDESKAAAVTFGILGAIVGGIAGFIIAARAQ